MKRLGILPIFNLPYSPQFNGIESVFSVVKGNYKRLLLRKLLEEKPIRVRQLIERSLAALTPGQIEACLQHSEKQIECLKV